MKYMCRNCGHKAVKKKDEEGLMIVDCPQCGYSMYLEDYNDDIFWDEHFVGYDDLNLGPDIPEGCAACGGPYPDCMISCSMFDD